MRGGHAYSAKRETLLPGTLWKVYNFFDQVDSFGTQGQAVLAMCTTEGYALGNPLDL